jgi:hypothetical protein
MKAGQILKLAGQNYIDNLPAHLRDGAIKQLNVVVQAADTFNADLDAAAANRDLSPDGRSATKARVAASALATLAAIETTTIKTLTERAASLEQALLAKVTYTPPTDPGERLALEMRLREVRDQLRQLPMEERANVYRTTTDPLALAAIDTATPTLSAPRPDGSRRMEPFIDPAERTAAALARAEAADPATATTLREVRALRQVYTHAVNGVRAEILAEVPGAVPVLVPATA